MVKRRKFWWIVGGITAAFALFIVTVFLIDYNSTDAKIERAVAQIVEEHGFEVQDERRGAFDKPSRMVRYVLFNRMPLDVDTASEIVASLNTACPSWKHDYSTSNVGNPNQETHHFSRLDQYEGRVSSVVFVYDYEAPEGTGVKPIAGIVLYGTIKLSLWQRIKRMWPW